MTVFNESVTYKPFNYPWAMELYTTHEAMHWVPTEIDLSEDISDWALKLTKDEKTFVTNILRIFTQLDVSVAKNYCDAFLPWFKNNEIRCMLMSFAAREAIHQKSYAMLNETLGLPDSDWKIFLEYKEMSDKIETIEKIYTDERDDIAIALGKSIFNEGVLLFASFAMLLNFQRFNKMKGACKIVEWSIRDENLHVEGNAKLYITLLKEFPYLSDIKPIIENYAEKIVNLEDAFIDLVFNNITIEGISPEDVKQYIRYIADRRLIQIGYKGKFNQRDNPLEWINSIIIGVNHTNFFEQKVTDYSKGNLLGNWADVYEQIENKGD